MQMISVEQTTEAGRPKIIPLDERMIEQANRNSLSGKRGKLSKSEYESYAEKILSWEISDAKKEKLLKKLYEKYTEMLRHEAQHVSVAVAGASNYDAKRLDHSDKILRLAAEFTEWFKDLEEQVKQGQREIDKAKQLIDMLEFIKQNGEYDPTEGLKKLALYDAEAFVKYYEEFYPTRKWRKNSTIAKLYESAKAGTLKVIEKEVFFEDENLKAYTEGDRVYIKFRMKPKRQLIIALKSRGYWWNSGKEAWSTYTSKLDKEWVKTISERYEQYI